jgi:hypothetical protein
MGKYESSKDILTSWFEKTSRTFRGKSTVGMFLGRSAWIVGIVLISGLALAEDALFIDESGKVKVQQIEVQGDIHAAGTVKAGKLEGDGSSIVVKDVTLENHVAQLLDKIAALEARQKDISASLAKWGDQNKVSYGDGAYVKTDKQAICPEGYYVVGLRVHYRGTCLGKCDADGGIIGDIELDCRKLGVR